MRTQKQQLLLLSDKKTNPNVATQGQQNAASPYKAKRKKQQSTEDFDGLDHNSLMDEDNMPRRPAAGERTFTSLTDSNKLLFHKSIEFKHKPQNFIS